MNSFVKHICYTCDSDPKRRENYGNEFSSTLFQECAIGGDHRPEALLGCGLQKQGQLGMDQWLTHKVIVDIFRLPRKLVKDMGEFL